MQKHILELSEKEQKKLDFLIYGCGGQSDLTWAFVSVFGEYSPEGRFSVLMPYKAYSASTITAPGTDGIMMMKKAKIGPSDINFALVVYNSKEKDSHQRFRIFVEDAIEYFLLLEKVVYEKPSKKMKGFELITNHVYPLAYHVLEIAEDWSVSI